MTPVVCLFSGTIMAARCRASGSGAGARNPPAEGEGEEMSVQVGWKDMITLKPGDVLFRDGEPVDCMYLVLGGRLRIVKMLGREEHEINVVEAGDFLGEMSLLEGETRSAAAIATTE